MTGGSREARLLSDTKVLVIGNDLGTRRIGRWEDLDYRVAAPEDALRMFYEVRPKAVLVDCPEDSSVALELIEKVRIFSELPILAMADDSDAGVHALHAGADTVVPKPLSREELWLRVERQLTRSDHLHTILGDSCVEIDRLSHRVAPAARDGLARRLL